jgi:hypothetical protein
MTVERAVVTEFLELHARHAADEKRLEELKKQIKPLLREGRTSPADLPFVLALRKRTDIVRDYHGALQEVLRRFYPKSAQVQLAYIEDQFETRESESLVVERNPEWKPA